MITWFNEDLKNDKFLLILIFDIFTQ